MTRTKGTRKRTVALPLQGFRKYDRIYGKSGWGGEACSLIVKWAHNLKETRGEVHRRRPTQREGDSAGQKSAERDRYFRTREKGEKGDAKKKNPFAGSTLVESGEKGVPSRGAEKGASTPRGKGV